MNIILNLLTITLLTGGLFATTIQPKADDYFTNFEKNLEELTKHIQPPKNSTSRMFEVSLINPGNVEDGKIYARFAGASYCENSSLTNWTCTHCSALGAKVENLKVFEDAGTETKGYIAVNKGRSEIIVSFRGSSNMQNWLLNAQFSKVAINFGGNTYYVHNGFKKISDNLFGTVSSNLKSLLSYYSEYNVVFTGHSLGASVADLIALRTKYELGISDDKLKLYTYGAPRVGDPAFARFVNHQKFTIGRFVNYNDVVPHLPPEISNYNHHQQELWVSGMNTQVCGTEYLEDPNCSSKTWYYTSSESHRKIWDISLGNASC